MGPGSDAVDTSRLRACLGVALAAFLAASALSWARMGHGAPDFYVFWAAARHWRAPYDPSVIAQLEASIHLTGVWPFAYPPTFLLFVRPFALLPLPLAYPLWTGLSAALFTFAASVVVKPPWTALALLATPAVFIAGELGQTTLIVGAAMIGGLHLKDRSPALAGALLAVAICIKPQAMIMAPVVLWGQWRVLSWATAAGLLLVAASLAFGSGRWSEWLHAVSGFSRLAPATERINPSALVAATWWAALMAGLGVWLAWSSRDLAGLAGGALLATPYAHMYDLAPLTPLALAWVLERRRRGWGLAIAGAALLGGLVATPLAALVFGAALLILERAPARVEQPSGPRAGRLASAGA